MSLARFSRQELLDAPDASFRHETGVRLQDVDAAGVVFFARYFELFNDALLSFTATHGFSLRTMMERESFVLPVRSAEAHFIAPLRVEDRVETGLVRCRVSSEDFVVGYRVRVRRDDGRPFEPAAVGVTHHVCADARRFVRRVLPGRLAAALAALEPGP